MPVPVHHVVSFRIISPIFLRFPRLEHCHSDFLVITHLPSQVSQYATRTSVLQATSPLCSKRLRWLVLTMIACEMSPLKQQAWQDCRAFSLWGVQQAWLFIMHPLLLTIPLTHVMCIMGLMASRLEWGCQSQVSFGTSWIVFFFFYSRSADELGHLSHVFAEDVCPVFADLFWRMAFGTLFTLLGKI